MNPMHLEIVKACMAADVMMGHDPDCARWIRRFREVPPLQASGAAAAATPRARHAGGARWATGGAHKVLHDRQGRTEPRTSDPSAWVVFTPSGKRGRFPSAHHSCKPPGASGRRRLGGGGRALCGRCRYLVMEGDFPKHGVSSQAANLSP